jgi:hypothetical protein
MEHFEYGSVKITMEATFNSHDLACFHDTIINVSNKHLNQDELVEIWRLLPIEIQVTAIQWGMSDTGFREDVYGWAEKNLDKLEKYTTCED